MNDINLRKYLLRTSAGDFWRVLPKNNSIVLSKSLKDGRWSTPLPLKDMHPCFYADLDNKDNIHIISQDLCGNLFYYKMQNNNINKFSILKSESDTAFDRSFFMLQRSTSPIFFYAVRKDTGSMLVYQTFWKNTPTLPVPICYIPETTSPFWITLLDKKTAIIFYPRVSGLYIQICARTLGLESLLLSPPRVITSEDANCEMPKAIVFSDGNMHLIYTIRKNGKIYLKYLTCNFYSLELTKAQVISSTLVPFKRYSIEYSNNRININWLENGHVYYREKQITDEAFTAPSVLRLNNIRTVEYYSYKSNTPHEKDTIIFTEEPVSFDGRIQHGFYREDIIGKKRVENSPMKNSDNKDLKMPSDAILKLVTGLLANQVVNKNSKQNSNIKDIGEIITELSKTMNASNGEIENNNTNKNFKLYRFDKPHKFKAAKVN